MCFSGGKVASPLIWGPAQHCAWRPGAEARPAGNGLLLTESTSSHSGREPASPAGCRWLSGPGLSLNTVILVLEPHHTSRTPNLVGLVSRLSEQKLHPSESALL